MVNLTQPKIIDVLGHFGDRSIVSENKKELNCAFFKTPLKRRNCRNVTCDAGVAGFQVGHHVLVARLLMVKTVVRQRNDAPRSSGTAPVDELQDVRRTSDLEFGVYASAEAHPTVSRCVHDDQTIGVRAGSVEKLPLTIVAH